MTKTTSANELKCDILASKWLGNANEAEEKGEYAKAERMYQKAQYWLDRYNKAAGNR